MSQRPRLHVHRWEAVYADDFTLDALRRRCARFGAFLRDRPWRCLVSHDTRFLAASFARYAYTMLAALGARVLFCPNPAPFPAVELALEQKRAECALLVSAGNRPHWYNGLILLAPQDGLMLVPGEPPVEAAPFPPPPLAETPETQLDLRGPYQELLRGAVDIELVRRATLTVFVDAMHGTTSGLLPAVLGEGAQTKAVEINRETDPLFGRQPPQPLEAGLTRLRKLVKESDSHLGVALSADGRALGVADSTGDLMRPGELALLLAAYLAAQHRQRGLVVVPQGEFDDAGLRRWEQEHGLKVEAAADPAVRIQEVLAQDRGSLLAGITAAGELTLGRYGAAPDAALAALVLIEQAARSGGKLQALRADLRGTLAPQRAS
jgi:phosphomannomutase